MDAYGATFSEGFYRIKPTTGIEGTHSSQGKMKYKILFGEGFGVM